ncbi:hypothetical protein ACVIWU_006701 [Bradyrhizobium sp. USDA 4509]
MWRADHRAGRGALTGRTHAGVRTSARDRNNCGRLASAGPDRLVQTVRERFIATRDSDGRRGIRTPYAAGPEPDKAIYDLLLELHRDDVPECHWQDRAYEVAEEFNDGTLTEFAVYPADLAAIERLVGELGPGRVHALTEAGLRRRDLRPSVIFVRSRAHWTLSSAASVSLTRAQPRTRLEVLHSTGPND